MTKRPPRNLTDERGFTLIEILVVVLVIAILAALSIPTFLNQKTKATDASAKSLARSAETAAETYASDHGGTYAGIEPSSLKEIDTAMPTVAGGSNNAWLQGAQAIESNAGYKVTTASTTGGTFSVIRKANGAVERVCKGVTGGCPASGSW
jgi:type IV pilus assembly protein PilA